MSKPKGDELFTPELKCERDGGSICNEAYMDGCLLCITNKVEPVKPEVAVEQKKTCADCIDNMDCNIIQNHICHQFNKRAEPKPSNNDRERVIREILNKLMKNQKDMEHFGIGEVKENKGCGNCKHFEIPINPYCNGCRCGQTYSKWELLEKENEVLKKVFEPKPTGKQETCEVCKGKGEFVDVEDRSYTECSYCNGTGKQPQESKPTDKEQRVLWTHPNTGDTIFVTKDLNIGIRVNGIAMIMHIGQWHKIAEPICNDCG